MRNILPRSIVTRNVLVTISLIVMSAVIVLGVLLARLSGSVMDEATRDARDAMRGMTVLYASMHKDARVSLKDGEVAGFTLDEVRPDADHRLVDEAARMIDGVATVFVKEGNDFVRLSTNVKKENGDRAVGTKLAADHPAQAVLARGEAYFGPAVLFGKDFITGYYPIKDTKGATVGVLFIGIPTIEYFNKIAELRLLTIVTGVCVAIVFGVIAFVFVRRQINPLRKLTGSVQAISQGRLDTDVPCLDMKSEFGDIARALSVFRDNALAKARIERETEEARAEAESERRARENEKLTVDGEIDRAVSALAEGMERLARGDLSLSIDTPFSGRLEKLRLDFNTAIGGLRRTLSDIRAGAEAIQARGGRMRDAADTLARRTETQAASLEETAAAVEEITVTVKSAAERAGETNAIVLVSKKSADSSADVVSNAVAAMGRIEEASGQIEQIIEVIDDIAFQTNLLALNAGIEAARAGEAGKGFAVVAQEVRELAQRTGEAARQIKDLIAKSSREVDAGSELVEEAGKVLQSISAQIVTISQHVGVIATASSDQSAALQGVNSSVARMDQMTQENAALVSDTASASEQLSLEADRLMEIVDGFRFAAEADPQRRAA
ncbi:methyl-accepting chemotaxis protein [Rhizobium sp. RU20A]|uniref:methyl-accepting chemotaxis protein n=1 Tax=Rhizobium sp. RU20A TaxID=1907412 RepID=UPI000954C807|nr:methyl-accepting chemotaxis protein [Rhizobium sp. RU20A]SIQ54137.1 methyl-accepting chemotaxis protein [Rhizobium sp. RU20A]